MKLVISKHKFRFWLLLAMIIWYAVPIVQEKGGMKLIAGLILLWFFLCDFRHHRSANYLMIPYALMMCVLSVPLLVGKTYYGGVDGAYFVCSSLLLFFPIYLFNYYHGKMTHKESACVLRVFFLGLTYGAVNTCIVLEQYPMASRLMATSYGDVYSQMGAGGYGFAYVLMLIFPLLLNLISKAKIKGKIVFCGITVLFFLTLVKCEYTTCLLLALLGISIYIFYNSNKIVGVLLITFVGLISLISGNLGNIFIWLANIFQDTEVIAVRLLDVANIFLEDSIDAMNSSRYTLYQRSLNGFLECPIFGTIYSDKLISGGHSTILDSMALYGLLGLMAVLAAFIVPIRRVMRTIKRNSTYRIVVMVFFVLSFLNPTIYIYQLGMVVFFIAPLMLNTFQRRMK